MNANKAAGIGGSKGVLPTRSSPRKYGFVMANISKSMEGGGRDKNQLIETKERCEAEGLDMTIDEIFNSVVPPKSGYVQGFGHGPKPMSRALRLNEQRRKEVEDRAKSAKERNEELTKQIEELRARQDRIEDSLFQRIR
ncbi:hypothetical protein FNV43_RR24793 [Rhamnella rubrinervis]|uniref:Uncharacterized protein n=1 Tax=Rhamnella rubrinervis TaxID=2594499 RepID=A0A8K0GTI5_9ROSA|nr:hypothetical protein FNV43_RR24793 [Rhamnella rubrinervis]